MDKTMDKTPEAKPKRSTVLLVLKSILTAAAVFDILLLAVGILPYENGLDRIGEFFGGGIVHIPHMTVIAANGAAELFGDFWNYFGGGQWTAAAVTLLAALILTVVLIWLGKRAAVYTGIASYVLYAFYDRVYRSYAIVYDIAVIALFALLYLLLTARIGNRVKKSPKMLCVKTAALLLLVPETVMCFWRIFTQIMINPWVYLNFTGIAGMTFEEIIRLQFTFPYPSAIVNILSRIFPDVGSLSAAVISVCTVLLAAVIISVIYDSRALIIPGIALHALTAVCQAVFFCMSIGAYKSIGTLPESIISFAYHLVFNIAVIFLLIALYKHIVKQQIKAQDRSLTAEALSGAAPEADPEI